MDRLASPSRQAQGLRAAILGTLVTILMAAGAAAQTATAFQLRDGAVFDPGAGLAYLMSPDGGIDAVDLGLGTVLWHSDAADRPISASNAGILAQAEALQPGSLQLAVLDASGSLQRNVTVELPDGVEAPVVDGLSHRFLIRANALADGRFEVEWQSTFVMPRGALIADDASAPVVKTGAFMLDPGTGAKVDGAPPSGPLSRPEILVPEVQRVDAPGSQYFSADRSNLLASVSGSGASADTYQWTIYDSNGLPLGSLENRAAYTPFHVSNGLVVFETRPGARLEGGQMVAEPLSVRAVSLSNGAEQWSFAIRDIEYRGPFPP